MARKLVMFEVRETVWIPMPDGAKMAARLWLPQGEGPFPAILEYIPYRRRDKTRMRDESMHPGLVEAGYAALRVDMRGSGDSDGVMLDEYSEVEIQDGVDVVAWIAAQDWCDGNVGMFGKSWGAFSALQVAARRPPALKAIAPVMGTDDRYNEDIHFYGGVLGTDNFWWGTVMQLLNALPPDPAIVGERWREMWKDRLEAMTFWPAQWLEHQTKDDSWRHGSVSEAYGDIEVPVYYFGGWADHYRDTAFRLAENLSGPVKVMMGPWGHLYPHEGAPGPQVDFVGELVRFWDHWLRGKDTGLMDEPPVRAYLQETGSDGGDARGRWVEEPDWPSPQVSDLRLWLNDGALGEDAVPGGAMEICSPQTFGAAGGDMMSFATPGDRPQDGRIDAGGALVFRGERAAAAVDILGVPWVDVRLAADKPQGFVVALLYDEAPCGAQALISRGFANLMHRDGDEAAVPVVPGEEMSLRVPLRAIGYRLAAGHRLIVQIASAYWPILWPAPQAVTLTLEPGRSALHVPVRRGAEGVVRELAPPPERAPAKVSTVRDGSMTRTTTLDLVSGVQTSRLYVDGGVFGPVGRIRLDETATELEDISDRVYAIRADDPLSAVATMDQDCVLEREGWQVRILTSAKMTASAGAFHLEAAVDCFDGEEAFHRVTWSHDIPRNGM